MMRPVRSNSVGAGGADVAGAGWGCAGAGAVPGICSVIACFETGSGAGRGTGNGGGIGEGGAAGALCVMKRTWMELSAGTCTTCAS